MTVDARLRTEARIRRCADAEFAFLGACETAVGGSRLPEEAINLAAGMQFAGYRHVIGTLWSVADTATARVARLEPYNPNKAVVLVIHGLMDTPATWTPLVNDLRSDHMGGAHAAFADGSVHFLRESLAMKTLAALCTRAGNEVIGEFD